jgi:predicted DsbA family dithiol-disulfide isomerase
METLPVQVWSDIACPWCYIGKRRLEAAIRRVAPDIRVDVRWRSFELDPSAPREQPAGTTYAARLARKYGIPEREAQERIDSMTEVAASDGLELRFDRIRPGNTFDAHRLLHLAHERGLQDALKERLFRAYFSEGAAIGDTITLTGLGVEAGLPRDEVERILESDAYGGDVRSDEAEAQRLGIHGVPFFVLANRYGVSGAQPSDVLVEGIRRSRAG